ncbi:MAG: MopE-related protein, partial [Candidatus Pacebacteria bacterium]|nr:MopE-related protein [Candidatus Paceibacterota bacterium]
NGQAEENCPSTCVPGSLDCPVCSSSASEKCADNIDNDCDGQIDEGCSIPETKKQCNDNLDNDGDSKIDMIDPGCSSPYDDDETDSSSCVPGSSGCPICAPLVDEKCGDKIDNNCNGQIDENCPINYEAPSLNFFSDKVLVKAGESFTLTWISRNSDICQASGGWNGVKFVVGQEVVGSINSDTVFTMECSGPG